MVFNGASLDAASWYGKNRVLRFLNTSASGTACTKGRLERIFATLHHTFPITVVSNNAFIKTIHCKRCWQVPFQIHDPRSKIHFVRHQRLSSPMNVSFGNKSKSQSGLKSGFSAAMRKRKSSAMISRTDLVRVESQ